jgi:hypothetical protein
MSVWKRALEIFLILTLITSASTVVHYVVEPDPEWIAWLVGWICGLPYVVWYNRNKEEE